MTDIMPWQHWLVVLEMLVSSAFAVRYLLQGYIQRTPFKSILWAVSDVLVIALLISGAREMTWQIYTLCALYAWAIWHGLLAGFRGKKETLGSDSAGTAFFVIMLILFTLLLTGQPG